MDDPTLYSSPPPSTAGSSPARTPASVRRMQMRARGGAYDDGTDNEAEAETARELEAIDEEEESVNGVEADEEQWEEGDRPLEQ